MCWFSLRIIIFFYCNLGGSDYDAAEVITATFVRQNRSVTISIPIVTGGDVVEPPEFFTVELQLPMETKQKGVYTVSPATAQIEIIDGMKFLHSLPCMYNSKDYIRSSQYECKALTITCGPCMQGEFHEPSQLHICMFARILTHDRPLL